MHKTIGVFVLISALAALSACSGAPPKEDAQAATDQAKVEAKAGVAGAKAGSGTKAPAGAGEAADERDGSLEVSEILIATGIQDREPVGEADTFPADVNKLYCYTKVEGGSEGDTITHKWLKDGEVMAEVTLDLGGSPWRTYSSKLIMPEWTGAWITEVLHNGVALTSKPFTIQ